MAIPLPSDSHNVCLTVRFMGGTNEKDTPLPAVDNRGSCELQNSFESPSEGALTAQGCFQYNSNKLKITITERKGTEHEDRIHRSGEHGIAYSK